MTSQPAPAPRVDAFGIQPYPEGLYDWSLLVAARPGLASIDDGAVAEFEREGFVAVSHVLSPGRVEDARTALADLVAGKNPQYKGVEFEASARDRLSALSAEERIDAVRKLMHFTAFDARLKAVCDDPAILAVVSRLMGGKKPVMFQDMALLKPPHGREKPWHQDNAYFDYDPLAPVVGVWIALDRATPENGCMHMIPGSHRGGAALHFKKRDWQICDTQILGTRCVAAPLEPGGALFFHGLCHHGTPTNNTDQRRRALQFHYAPHDTPKVSWDTQKAAFGGEVRGATC